MIVVYWQSSMPASWCGGHYCIDTYVTINGRLNYLHSLEVPTFEFWIDSFDKIIITSRQSNSYIPHGPIRITEIIIIIPCLFITKGFMYMQPNHQVIHNPNYTPWAPWPLFSPKVLVSWPPFPLSWPALPWPLRGVVPVPIAPSGNSAVLWVRLKSSDYRNKLLVICMERKKGTEYWGKERTPETPWALFSPAPMGLSLWGGALAYSEPRGMME